jgi:hypothetical protein
MGCGCNKKRTRTASRRTNSATKGKVVRKNRVSKLISIPGKTRSNRISKKTKG